MAWQQSGSVTWACMLLANSPAAAARHAALHGAL
jgi:hypothetical protein